MDPQGFQGNLLIFLYLILCKLQFSGHLAAEVIASCPLIKLPLVQKHVASNSTHRQHGAKEQLKAGLEMTETATVDALGACRCRSQFNGGERNRAMLGDILKYVIHNTVRAQHMC